jgi:hypothetical protein
MQQSQIPPSFPIPWANGAGGAYIRSIPQASQIGIQNGAASLTDGFPPLTFTPPGAGGVPPFGEDFNGILKQLSQWAQWQGAGGPILYSSAISAAIGGYANGAKVLSRVTLGTVWMSAIDDNLSDPDAGGAGWTQDPGQVPIGTPVQSLTTTVPFGYVSANGLTIGDASSNATNRAVGDTKFLFTFVWNNFSNTQCPIFTSAGSPSTRGATAAADFAAHKAIAVPNMNGIALMGADSQSGTTTAFLNGVPVTSGSRTAPGSILGENFHALSSAENGAHTHGNTLTNNNHTHQEQGYIATGVGGAGFAVYLAFSLGDAGQGISGTLNTSTPSTAPMSINNVAAGSGTGHNTVERSMIVYWNLKL